MATGERTQAITGEVQSLFDGSDEIKEFDLAWIEAYLLLAGSADHSRLDTLAETYRPLGSSKHGGNQTLIWQELQ